MTTAAKDTPPAETTITVKAADLVRVLSDAIPFAGTDETLPQLRAVLLEAVDGTLTATATNRYVMGHARTTCDGGFGGQVVIGLDDAKLIAKLFRPSAKSKAGPDVTVTAGGDVVRFAYSSDGSLGVLPELGVGVRRVNEEFPKYEDLLTKMLAKAKPAEGRPFGVAPHFLALFSRLPLGHGEALHVHVHGEASPVVFEIPDRFVGLLMPVRIGQHGKEMPKGLQTTVGHPVKPARRSRKGAAA